MNNEPRVQRLLRDARAAVNRPVRPETPREPMQSRLPTRRLSSVMAADGGAVQTLTPSLGLPALVDGWCSGLRAAAQPEDTMALLSSISRTADWRVIRPSEEPAMVALVTSLADAADGSKGDDANVAVSVRAASLACKISASGASPALSDGLVSSCAVLHHLAKCRNGGLLKDENVLDTLTHLLRMQSVGWCRDAIFHAAATLRYCSSEGGPLLVHLATLGLLPATATLTLRLLPTADAEVLGHCAIIFRNFSVDYAHHFSKLECIPVVLQLLVLATTRGWKDVVAALSRSLAKLVFDDDCVQVLLHCAVPATVGAASCTSGLSVMVRALVAYGKSKMIGARLGTAVAVLLQQAALEEVDAICNEHGSALSSWVREALLQHRPNTTSGRDADAAAMMEEAVESLWRIVGALSLSMEGGKTLTSGTLPVLLDWLEHRGDAAIDCDSSAHRNATLLALMCLSNLSYYFPTQLGESGTEALLPSLGTMVAGLLFAHDTEVVVEATRILGNMSATVCGREWIESRRCDEVCLALLLQPDRRVVYNCFGVILNLTAADRCRIVSEPELCSQLLQETGKFHLLNVTDDGSDDAQISTLVEKILLNISALV